MRQTYQTYIDSNSFDEKTNRLTPNQPTLIIDLTLLSASALSS